MQNNTIKLNKKELEKKLLKESLTIILKFLSEKYNIKLNINHLNININKLKNAKINDLIFSGIKTKAIELIEKILKLNSETKILKKNINNNNKNNNNKKT